MCKNICSFFFFFCLRNIIILSALFNRKYSYEYCCFKLFCCRCVKTSAVFLSAHAILLSGMRYFIITVFFIIYVLLQVFKSICSFFFVCLHNIIVWCALLICFNTRFIIPSLLPSCPLTFIYPPPAIKAWSWGLWA